MASSKEAERMRDYIIARLSDSGIYVRDAISKDHLVLNAHLSDDVHLFLHSKSEGAEDFKHKLHILNYNGQLVSNIFYKDEKTFFVPLNQRQRGAFRASMERYGFDGVMKSVVLRDKEDAVFDVQGAKRLVYYQPSTVNSGGRLPEGIVSFLFNPILPDYSHIPSDEKGYDLMMRHNNTVLKRRKITDKKVTLNHGLRFIPSRKDSKLLILAEDPVFLRANSLPSELIASFLKNFGGTVESWGGREKILEILSGEQV